MTHARYKPLLASVGNTLLSALQGNHISVVAPQPFAFTLNLSQTALMLYETLYQNVKMRFGDGDATKSMGDWICANTHLKKRPFSFDGHGFQKAIADDMHPNMSVKKCSQIGLTEVQIRKFLAFLARSTAISGIFSLPNEKMFTKVYNGRIKPILEQEQVFNPPSAFKPVRNKDQVQIRDSFGYITACTEADATSINADFLMHDELDLSPQEIIALYQSRTQGSDIQITQSFSTPTFQNFGISKNYDMTDQREYVMKCASCGKTEIPLFRPKFVHVEDFHFDVESFMDLTTEQLSMLNLENTYVKCPHCGARLDLGDNSHREWVAKHPLRQNFRGYQVRPFSTPRIKPAYIFKQLAQHQERGTLRRFYNTVLGEEYTSADARIQVSDVELAMSKGESRVPDIPPDTACYLGIDVGFTCHITISYDDAQGWPHFVLWDTVPAAFLVKRVEELMKIYNIVQGVIDRFPYTNESNQLRDLTHGIIMPVQWRGDKPLVPQMENDTKTLSHYTAGMTYAMDRVQQLLQHKKMIISGYTGQKQTVIDHLHSMVRNDDPSGEAEFNELALWLKTDGNDHYMHAAAFNLLSRRISEHLFTYMMSTIATSPSFYGQQMGKNTIDLIGNSPKGLERISRMGR